MCHAGKDDGLVFSTASEKKQLKHASETLGIPLGELGDALHAIKHAAGLKGKSVPIDPDGTVRDPVSGEEIGNLLDE
jgi:hypothetical protein